MVINRYEYRVSHRIRFPDRLLGQAVEFQYFSVNSVVVFVRESGQSRGLGSKMRRPTESEFP